MTEHRINRSLFQKSAEIIAHSILWINIKVQILSIFFLTVGCLREAENIKWKIRNKQKRSHQKIQKQSKAVDHSRVSWDISLPCIYVTPYDPQATNKTHSSLLAVYIPNWHHHYYYYFAWDMEIESFLPSMHPFPTSSPSPSLAQSPQEPAEQIQEQGIQPKFLAPSPNVSQGFHQQEAGVRIQSQASTAGA